MRKERFIPVFKNLAAYSAAAMCILCGAAGASWAGNYANGLILEISGVHVVEDFRFTPCYPVNGFFTHPDPRVTKIRMENPRNPAQYIEYPKNTDIHIHIHEGFMKQDIFSWSNFIAMDNAGNEYGRILVTFDPPADSKDNNCNGHFNS